MTDIVFTWHELLIVIALAALIYLLESLYFSKRRRAGQLASFSELRRTLNKLESDLAALSVRLDMVENMFRDSDSGKTAEADSIFERAVHYAQEGMLPQEIVSRTGLSLSEATLIVTMHKEGG